MAALLASGSVTGAESLAPEAGAARPDVPARDAVPPSAPSARAEGKGRQEAGDGNGFLLPGSRSRAPIHIDADELEFDARQEVAVFRGSVVTSQDDVTMRSSTLRVTFASSDGDARTLDRVQSVVAEGDVEIQQGDRVARGTRAEFNDAERTVVLTGGAVLHDGPSEVRGDRVIVYLDEERSIVEGENTRVKAILIPKKKADDDQRPQP